MNDLRSLREEFEEKFLKGTGFVVIDAIYEWNFKQPEIFFIILEIDERLEEYYFNNFTNKKFRLKSCQRKPIFEKPFFYSYSLEYIINESIKD